MKAAKIAAVALGTAAMTLQAGPGLGAAASATPAGGPVRVWATPIGNGLRSSIVITGAIGDYGTATSITASGTPNLNGNYVRIALRRGTFEVNSTALNAKANKAQPIANAATCSGFLSVSDPVTVFNGTGLYKGITGTVNITETFAFIGPRYSSGPHKGQCNETNSAQPIATFSSIVGSGTVHFA